ncbi:hypothetical protein LA080_001436 [Diaporthe eres]|uniref:Cell wall protein n=1 Tax=Diaporthe vaccinii TaxID=105482 RepID=A0ABR4E1I4_9PEZI|nr:hypothetical protein LA080_001436 [Diaporthe eres]
MLMLTFLLALLSLLIGVSAAHAGHVETVESTPAVLEHLKEVQNQTVEMALVVEKWNGDIIDSIFILAASNTLIKAIEDGTDTAKNLPKDMTTRQCIRVKRATKELLEDIKSSLGTITRSKPLFDHAGLTSTMISKIEDTKEAAENLIAAIVDKLSVGKGIGRRLGKKISAAFDSAIEDFSKEPGRGPGWNDTRSFHATPRPRGVSLLQ